MSGDSTPDILAKLGLMDRREYAKAHNKCDATMKRWQDQGLIVVTYIGNKPYVVLDRTAERMRGRPPKRRASPKKRTSPESREAA